MDAYKELYKLKVQKSILLEVMEQYKTCSVSNVIQQIDSRIKHLESQNKE